MTIGDVPLSCGATGKGLAVAGARARVTAGAAERSGRTAPFLAVRIGKLLGRGGELRMA